MTKEEKAEYDELREKGYALLKQAHRIWMDAWKRRNPDSK